MTTETTTDRWTLTPLTEWDVLNLSRAENDPDLTDEMRWGLWMRREHGDYLHASGCRIVPTGPVGRWASFVPRRGYLRGPTRRRVSCYKRPSTAIRALRDGGHMGGRWDAFDDYEIAREES